MVGVSLVGDHFAQLAAELPRVSLCRRPVQDADLDPRGAGALPEVGPRVDPGIVFAPHQLQRIDVVWDRGIHDFGAFACKLVPVDDGVNLSGAKHIGHLVPLPLREFRPHFEVLSDAVGEIHLKPGHLRGVVLFREDVRAASLLIPAPQHSTRFAHIRERVGRCGARQNQACQDAGS